nr:MAG TPA: hypothetical protein [Caudoviricetes sp.]
MFPPSRSENRRGLGFTTVATSGNEIVRWARVRKYLEDFGIATSCDGHLPDYIPENVFYRLGKIIHCPHSVKRRVGVPREARYTTCRQKISTRTKMYEFSRKATERWNARLTTTNSPSQWPKSSA